MPRYRENPREYVDKFLSHRPQMLARFGVAQYDPSRALGKGYFGYVFPAGEGKVLKVTDDPSEVFSAKNLAGRHPHLPVVFDVANLGEIPAEILAEVPDLAFYTEGDVYAILREDLPPVPDLRSNYGRYDKYVEDYVNMGGDWGDVIDVKTACRLWSRGETLGDNQEEFIRYISDKDEAGSDGFLSAIYAAGRSLSAWFYSQGLILNDAHLDNWGVRSDGTVVMNDLGIGAYEPYFRDISRMPIRSIRSAEIEEVGLRAAQEMKKSSSMKVEDNASLLKGAPNNPNAKRRLERARADVLKADKLLADAQHRFYEALNKTGRGRT